VPELCSSAAARESYLDLLRTQLPPAPAKDEDQPPPTFTDGAADTVFELAGASGDLSGTGLGGGAADLCGLDDAGGVGVTGGAAAFSLGGFLAGARNLLNLTTFYTMKNRAGLVGTNGVSAVLSALAESAPQARLHLTGHSFGARAVSAAAATTTAPLHSMSLLQGAFSHFGFATNWDGKNDNGVFVAAQGRLLGPLLVTHTVNDKAILLAYALASRLAQETAAGLGDASDPYGGLGASGALMTANTDDALLLDVGGAYAFAAGRVANLNADAFISGHSDVTGHQVGYAVLTAICV